MTQPNNFEENNTMVIAEKRSADLLISGIKKLANWITSSFSHGHPSEIDTFVHRLNHTKNEEEKRDLIKDIGEAMERVERAISSTKDPKKRDDLELHMEALKRLNTLARSINTIRVSNPNIAKDKDDE